MTGDERAAVTLDGGATAGATTSQREQGSGPWAAISSLDEQVAPPTPPQS